MLAKMSSEMPLPMPALGDQLAHPHQQHRARGQRDHDQEDLEQGEVGDQGRAGGLLEAPEQEHVADRLGEGQADGQVARVLRDPGLPDLALLGELLQRRHDDLQQLQDDRRGDVGHDAQREDGDPAQSPAREQVEQTEDVAAAEVLLDRVDGLRVDARRRDVRPEPVEREDPGGDQDLLADVADPERSEDRRDHEFVLSPR